jgi:Flp pilus assembly pilin Flp
MGQSTRRRPLFRAGVGKLWGQAAAGLAVVGHFLRGKDDGNSVVEYALLLSLVSLFILGAMTFLSSSMSNLFNNTANFLANLVR